MKEWQFNVLFIVGVGGAVLLLIGPDLGLSISQNPNAVAGVGAILAYVLTQKRNLVKGDEKKEDPPKEVEPTEKEEGNGV